MRFVLKNMAFRALATSPKRTTRAFFSLQNGTSKVTKHCACHEMCDLYFTDLSFFHHVSLFFFTFHFSFSDLFFSFVSLVLIFPSLIFLFLYFFFSDLFFLFTFLSL